MNNAVTPTVTFSDLGLNPTTTYTITELYSSTLLGTFVGSYTRTLLPGKAIILRISTTTSSLPTPPTNLALGQSASDSSIWGAGYEASQATDGNIVTRWSAANSPYNSQCLVIVFINVPNLYPTFITDYYNTTEYTHIQ